jgi:hypothetical protein
VTQPNNFRTGFLDQPVPDLRGEDRNFFYGIVDMLADYAE